MAFGMVALPHLDYFWPWMVLVFTVGMGAATIAFSATPTRTYLFTQVPWGWVCLLGLLGACAVIDRDPNGYYWGMSRLRMAAVDTSGGIAGLGLILWLARAHPMVTNGREELSGTFRGRAAAVFVLRMLESRIIVGLSRFSYSVYLLQEVALAAVFYLVLKWLLPGHELRQVLLGLVLAPAAGLGLGYVFHLVFERPFLAPETASIFRSR